MSNLSINDFTHLVIVRSSKETSNALADPKVREKDHRDIQSQVDEYLRRGGSINVVDSTASTGVHQVSKLTNPESAAVDRAVKNLRAAFGDDLDIRQDMHSGKYKVFYKGQQLGNMKTSLSKAEAAIRCEGLRDKNNMKLMPKKDAIQKYQKREQENKKRIARKSINTLMHGANL